VSASCSAYLLCCWQSSNPSAICASRSHALEHDIEPLADEARLGLFQVERGMHAEFG
jgi:hypothetical protein